MKIKNIISKLTLSVFFVFFLPKLTFANSTEIDFMHSIGKIYVVVAVIIAIFIGLIIYLVSLDRKLKSIENQIKDYE